MVLGGHYNLGKTPLMHDLAVRIAHGVPFAGRAVEKRPVAVIDFETPAGVFKRNIERISARLGVQIPLPQQLEVYLENDSPDVPSTMALIRVLHSGGDERVAFLRKILTRRPNTVVVIDPLELLFPFDKKFESEILDLYQKFRFLLGDFPRAAIIPTWNLRKRDKSGKPPNFLISPREWLEEISGSIAIMNRSDVRLGFDFMERNPEIRALNGLVRGEDFHPILLRPVGDPGELAGFEHVGLEDPDFALAFSPTQLQYWNALPVTFTFEEIAGRTVPRVSLSRLVARAKSLGLITKTGGSFRKHVVFANFDPAASVAPPRQGRV